MPRIEQIKPQIISFALNFLDRMPFYPIKGYSDIMKNYIAESNFVEKLNTTNKQNMHAHACRDTHYHNGLRVRTKNYTLSVPGEFATT